MRIVKILNENKKFSDMYEKFQFSHFKCEKYENDKKITQLESIADYTLESCEIYFDSFAFEEYVEKKRITGLKEISE